MKQRKPQKAFQRALKNKRLSLSPLDWNYLPSFLYMGFYPSSKGEWPKDQFKHMSGRYYLK